MSKVSVDIPDELLSDVRRHVGEDKKFVSTSDAIRSSLRKMLDQMEEVDRRRGRLDSKGTDEE
ncbi:MAG: type II toxin-antitoxin system ParD family antitoxin [Halobacteria archaeon]